MMFGCISNTDNLDKNNSNSTKVENKTNGTKKL